MITYVEYQGKKFDTISDAIEYAEEIEAETADIDVVTKNGDYIENQIATRNPYSHDLVYATWGVFIDNDNDEWISEINSYPEAYKIALDIKRQNPDADVYIQEYTQTLSENIENIGERRYIFEGELI